MTRPKLLFIADFKQKDIKPLLDGFIKKYASCCDILVSGYDYGDTKAEYKHYNNVKFRSMSSSMFMYYRNVAEYTVITTQAVPYTKDKSNQKVIYILSDFNSKTFRGHIGEVSSVVTDRIGTFDYFEKTYPHIDLHYVESNNGEIIESFLNALDIRTEASQTARTFLIVDANEISRFSHDEFGVASYLRKKVTNDSDSVIALTINRIPDDCTSNIFFDSSQRSISVLKEFDGTVLFYDEQSRIYFESYIKRNSIDLKSKRQMMFCDFQLCLLENTVREHDGYLGELPENNYLKYRALIQRLYEINHCSHVLVSIIICRYNTSMELLERAIHSALNTGHDNVEVIVVDDGSKDNIEKELTILFNDERVKYYYKENEGLGLSRNYGVQRATGDYVFYLDSDDTIHPDSMLYMVSHAVFYDLDLVIGKRSLCDEKGIPFNESLSYLAGDIFKSYYNDNSRIDIYVDVMVNNLLIRKEALLELDVWFTKGLYEDVEYSSSLYKTIKEYHYLNIIVHDWYQYGDNTTISSTATINNFLGRLEKENSAWVNIPDDHKVSRLSTIVSSDFIIYYTAYYAFSEEERLLFWEKMKNFVLEREEYIQQRYYNIGARELVRSILHNNQHYFDYVMGRYYATAISEGSYDNYIVATHYHLMVACLYALKNKRKSRLFICQSYTPFNGKLVHRMMETGLFESVKEFKYDPRYLDIFETIKMRPGEESVIIPNALYSSYRSLFKDCNKDLDTVYIFSDKTPYWYYVEREFSNIIKLEDAYKSFDREINMQKLTGVWGQIQQFEGNLYPLMSCKSKKIKKVIISEAIEDLPDYVKAKIEVVDTKQVEAQYHDEIKQILLSIYDIDANVFKANSTMVLTQPLANCGYCTKAEQKKLVKRMCDPYEKENILIKPHPADDMKYNYLGVNVLPKNVPTEVYNYLDMRIKRVVTFGSSAVETIEFADEKKVLFELHDYSFDDVGDAIKQLIKEPVSRRIGRKVKRKFKSRN